MTVQEVFSRMTPMELTGWYDHLTRYPPGDFQVQALLAELLAMIASAFSGKQHSPYEFAPNLEPIEKRRARAREAQRQREIDFGSQMSEAFEEVKKSGKKLKFN